MCMQIIMLSCHIKIPPIIWSSVNHNTLSQHSFKMLAHMTEGCPRTADCIMAQIPRADAWCPTSSGLATFAAMACGAPANLTMLLAPGVGVSSQPQSRGAACMASHGCWSASSTVMRRRTSRSSMLITRSMHSREAPASYRCATCRGFVRMDDMTCVVDGIIIVVVVGA